MFTSIPLPDMRGMFLRGVSGSSGRDADAGSRTAVKTGGRRQNAKSKCKQKMIKEEYKYSELTAKIIGCAMIVHT